jgi:two-component system phosphate regulon sensor histidine kinase PhoR
LRVGSTLETWATRSTTVMVRTELGGILKERREELAENWTRRTMSASSRYSERPQEEVQRNLAALLDAIIVFVETEDRSLVEEVVGRVSESRARSGFAFEDTLSVLFSGVQECIRVIKDECDAIGHSADCFQLADQLIGVFSNITILHAEVMEEIRRKSYAASAISDMANAYESLDGRSIIDRAADNIYNSYALDVTITLKGETENLVSSRCGDPATEETLATACRKAMQAAESASYDGTADGHTLSDRGPGTTRSSMTAIPITVGGDILGAIAVASREGASLAPYDIRMVESIAGYVGVACENARLFLKVSDAADKISKERSKLFSMLSGIEASVCVADMDTHEILAVNRVLENAFGKDLVGRKCYEVLQSGQSGPCSFCTNDRLMKDGEPTGPYSWKFRNTVTGRWYSCIDSAIMWPSGKHVRMELAFDITEAEEARIELENAKNLLELYNDLLLHDLGNYAGTSLAYVELALGASGLGEEGRNLLSSARGQMLKCRELLDKVSSFSRVLTTADDARDTVDLNDVLDKTAEEVMEMYRDSTPILKMGRETKPHNVKVGAFVKDIFLNLLTNAVKFGEGKKVDVRIDEDTLKGLPAWKVSIMDRGPGIAPERRERLFKRYSRLDRSKLMKGEGLGLSIAKTITERYGGELRVADRVEGDHTKGACFSVLLPKA